MLRSKSRFRLSERLRERERNDASHRHSDIAGIQGARSDEKRCVHLALRPDLSFGRAHAGHAQIHSEKFKGTWKPGLVMQIKAVTKGQVQLWLSEQRGG